MFELRKLGGTKVLQVVYGDINKAEKAAEKLSKELGCKIVFKDCSSLNGWVRLDKKG